MSLTNPDSNGIGRYSESTPLSPTQKFSTLLNLGIAAVSAALGLNFKDTGWVDLPTSGLQNGFTFRTGFEVQYRVRGGRVEYRGQFYRSTAPTPTNGVTAHSGVAPSLAPRSTLGVTNGDTTVSVAASGNINISSSVAKTSGAGYAVDGIGWFAG